jgi:hypothetical protein
MARYQPAMRRKIDEYNAVEIQPPELRRDFRLQTYHSYITTLSFSRESWRGRVRACKWIGPALPPETVQAFDSEHAQLLAKEPEPLQIEHLVQLAIYTRV